MGTVSAPIPLNFLPGVQRDGTRVDSESSVDAQWTRYRMARPRKMGGYHQTTGEIGGVGRKLHCFYKGSQIIIHIGTSNSLEQVILDAKGNFINRADRTPVQFQGGVNVGWTLDAIFDTTSKSVQIIAHAVRNLDILADDLATPPFIGLIDANTPLTTFSAPSGGTVGGTYVAPSVSGGIVCVQPYVMDFDSAGGISWSAPNLPDTLGVSGGASGAGRARVSAQKIVAGMALRGGGANSPASIFWSLSEVIGAAFVGQASGVFAFTTISPSSSILSGATVVEYDGLYFWAGIDRFQVYNGTVMEVPNSYNQDWFFDNLNRDAAGRSFAFKVPRFGEIWFCAPLFGATEPSHAVIFNVREKCWYDTELPNGGRGAAYFAQGFRYPIMTGVTKGSGGYSLWLHEHGFDQTGQGAPQPIRAFFETPFFGGPRLQQPDDHGLSLDFLEPDLIQTGDLSVWVAGGANPKSGDVVDGNATIKAIAQNAGEQIVGFKSQRRYARLHFESNALGGNFVLGKCLLHVNKGDESVKGAVGNPMTAQP